MNIRLRVGSWTALVLLTVGLGYAQMQPRLDDRAPAPAPTSSDITSARAVELARAFLRSIGVSVASTPKVSHTYARAGLPSVTWQVTFGDVHQLMLHARTGRVMQYIHVGKASDISKFRMMNTRNARQMRPVSPKFSRVPSTMLLTPNSVLMDEALRPVTRLVPPNQGLQARFVLNERPNGMPLFGLQPTVTLDFDPRDGALIEFSRSADVSLPSLQPKLAAARATQVAQAYKGELPMDLYALSGTNPKPALGLLMPRPAGRRAPSNFGILRLVWVVRSGDREIWVDATEGRVMGGVRAGRRPPRQSRTDAG